MTRVYMYIYGPAASHPGWKKISLEFGGEEEKDEARRFNIDERWDDRAR